MISTPYYEIAVLGAIQGLTEFLPVSSDGHLALAQALFGIREGNLALSVFLHAGTLLATALYFRKELLALIAGVPDLLRGRALAEEGAARDLLTILVASVPTALIGFSIKDVVEQWTRDPIIVALGFLVTALVLFSTRFSGLARLTQPTLRIALIVGFAQGLAVLPGVSRSGCTIAVLLWFGLHPKRAFELSMLISLPAVCGALLLEVPEALAGTIAPTVLLFGAGVAFVVGLGALVLLRQLVTAGRFHWFAAWALPLAVVTLLSRGSWKDEPEVPAAFPASQFHIMPAVEPYAFNNDLLR